MRRRAALAVGAALSIVLHAAVLPLFGTAGSRPGRPGPRAEGRPVQVRILAQAPAPRPQPPVTSQAPAAPPPVAQPAMPLPREAPRVVEPPAPSAPRQDAPGSASSGENGDDAWLPRSALTAGPTPRNAIIVPYPTFDGDRGRYSARLSLFIDETGTVRRVEMETPDLPEPLQAVARRAFLDARFTPGELEGRPVRSHIRIEVSFGSEPVGR